MRTATRTIADRRSIRARRRRSCCRLCRPGADRAGAGRCNQATQLATRGGKPVPFPFMNEPFTLPAGMAWRCTLALEPVVDRQVAKEFPADANGDIVQLISGTLVVRFTNLETGRSITINSSGPARIVLHPNGSFTAEYLGRSTFTFFPTDVPVGPLTVLNSGRMVIDFAPTGQAVLVSRTGHQEDLCAALA
jgi:hypothetical protein